MNKKDELFRVTEALRKSSFLYTTWIRDALNGELTFYLLLLFLLFLFLLLLSVSRRRKETRQSFPRYPTLTICR